MEAESVSIASRCGSTWRKEGRIDLARHSSQAVYALCMVPHENLTLVGKKMDGSVYIKLPSGKSDIEAGADEVFRALQISQYSERESSNYFGGSYFVGHCLGLRITVALADDVEFSEYSFCITVSGDAVKVDNRDVFEGVADLMARFLTVRDFKVARDPSGGKVGGTKLIYAISAASDARSAGRVEVIRID